MTTDKSPHRVLVSWSSGKDSAWMLHVLQQRPDVEIVGLMTTFNQAMDRVAMHAVRRELVEEQARSIGLPLWSVELPWPCSNAVYEERFAEMIQRAVAEGITHIAFGDLFLEEIRAYRIGQLNDSGLEPMFPIWCEEQGTAALASEIINAGFRSVLTCVDPKQVSADFVGREYDAQLLADLPSSVDPCGERGEFHSFCYAGPIFGSPIDVTTGERLHRDGFEFMDVEAV